MTQPGPAAARPVVWSPDAQRWYRHAVVYCADVDTYLDSDGDGWGDLRGLTSRLPHLARLGVTCLWLNPIHPTPNRDGGYDVADYYAVDPRLGTLGDFVELVEQAGQHGIRIMLDLVVNHTSDQHPWFRSARSSRESPYRDWYVWSDTEPADRHQGVVFPGEQDATWSWDDQAQAWYFHRFYDFQPDLNWANPAVRAEILRVMGFWIALGVSAFRIDAAPFVLELVSPGGDDERDFGILDEWRHFAQWRRGDVVLLGEANVSPNDVPRYFGGSEADADRMHMLFDFVRNPRLFLALARQDAEPIAEVLADGPAVPGQGQWVSFLRNHDELDLSRLTDSQRRDVFARFGPRPTMRLFERGIRRRLATMLGGDQGWIRLAYALQFSMPGTPVLRYGEELGMGENLALPGRDAFRTPMQWDASPNAGFSTAPRDRLVRPVLTRGPFSYKHVNVTAQRQDPDSLLTFMTRLISVRRECPEIGDGVPSVLPVACPRGVLAHRADATAGSLVFLHNLTDAAQTVDLSESHGGRDRTAPVEVFSDGAGHPLGDLAAVDLPPHGFRWIRVASNPAP